VIGLDVADLVVIAGRVLDIDAGDALALADIPAARTALALARPAGPEHGAPRGDRDAAAAAGIGLVHALLRHRPFPRQGEQVAVAAGLQFLSLNGWRADLDPPAPAAVVVEALASGQLSPDSAAAWLSPRLSPGPAPRMPRVLRVPRVPRVLRSPARVPLPSRRPLRALTAAAAAPARSPGGRRLISAVVAISAGGFALLATACAHAPVTRAAHHAGRTPVARHSERPRPASVTDQAYASCARWPAIAGFAAPSAGRAQESPVAGTSHSAPSGGIEIAAEAGMPCHGSSTAWTAPRLPTPLPP
jgi:hypothetical protein